MRCRTCNGQLAEDETTLCHDCWWAEHSDDEQDATLAAATTGSWDDYSYLDGEET